MKLRRTLIDNSDNGYKMTEAIRACLHDDKVTEVCIATGFWDLRGTALIYDELAKFLSRSGSKFRLLIGKDPYLYTSDTESYTKGRYDKQEQTWRVELDDFHAQEQYVKVVQMLVDNLEDDDNEKFQVHIYNPDGELKDQFLHSKCYIFKGQDEEERAVGYGIIGSSNLTRPGMEENSELNILEIEARDIINTYNNTKDKTHLQWFEEKWKDSVSWEKEFLLQITQSKMGPNIHIPEPKPREEDSPLTPYELYIKLLQYRFGDLVDKDTAETIEGYLPQGIDPLEYQMVAVKQCFSVMHEHKGFMLADVVGLGKTIVGTLVIKHFLEFPDPEGRERKVLIVTPPAIKQGWIDTINRFDDGKADKIMNSIDFITTGSIGNLVDNPVNDDEEDSGEFDDTLKHENYGLIIIDESHKFRNKDTNMYKVLDELIREIRSGVGLYPYIGLLSATPQNNSPRDLQNQIYLFERNTTESTLKKADSGNLESFFADKNARYSEIMHLKNDEQPDSQEDIKQYNEKLKELSQEIREGVLDDILVRRTRTDVKTYYEKDMKAQGLIFPEISGPHSLKYEMEPALARLFAETMNIIGQKLKATLDPNVEYLNYYRYRAIQYLSDPEIKNLYKGKNMDADRFSEQLARIMQMNLVKRLESSFSAFKASLRNLRRYTKNMIDMWEHDAIFICPQIDVNGELNPEKRYDKIHRNLTFDECANDIRAKINKLNNEGKNKEGRNREYHRDDFTEDYIELLRKDYSLIESLYDRWAQYDYDPKLEVFKDSLKPELFDKSKNTSQKLVIFSEAVDTAEALQKVVERKGFKSLLITAKNRKDKEQTIHENFDANYLGEKKDDYQIIITTDVLAEGINLHRANVILNYDTPWNSTRLMQRIGRVNRIGSTHSKVYVYNFRPSAQGDEEINLVQKAHTKLQSFHTLFGEDSKIFSDDEVVSHYELKKEFDGEESPYETYISQLREYKEKNPVRYKQIAQKNEGLEMSVGTNGSQYFVVNTPRTSGLFVEITADGKGRVISTLDMLENFHSEPDVKAIELPENWEESKKLAEKTYSHYLTRINVNAGRNKRATNAKEVVVEISDKMHPSESTQRILDDAFRLINRGNNDIAVKMIQIGQRLHDAEGNLYPMTTEEIDNIISNEIEKLVSDVQRRYGKATVYMGLAK